jgi:hypothetical protein
MLTNLALHFVKRCYIPKNENQFIHSAGDFDKWSASGPGRIYP